MPGRSLPNLSIFSSYHHAYAIVPPLPIRESSYFCSNRFQIDDILEMYGTSDSYGLIGVSGELVIYYLLSSCKGHLQVKQLGSLSQNLATHHRKGGQSQNRHQRNHEIQKKTFLTKIVERALEHYFVDNRTNCLIEKLAIFGPGKTKETVLNHPKIRKWFPRILNLFPTEKVEYETAVSLAERHLELFEIDPLMEALTEIEDWIQREPDRLVFGPSEVSRIPCEKIWLVTDTALKPVSQKTKLIPLASEFEMHYGSVVGLRWS